MAGHLALILPKRQRRSRSYHAAMSYAEVPAFIASLRERETTHTLALEFLILTAARVGEVLGAQWSEIDIALRTWIIPASRMKASREHRIPLSGRALAIVERMAELRSGDFVFPGQRRGRPLSNPSLARLCRAGVTVHGFRSAFRDWCGEETGFPREIAEAALAHSTGGPVGASLPARRYLRKAARIDGGLGHILQAGRGRQCCADPGLDIDLRLHADRPTGRKAEV